MCKLSMENRTSLLLWKIESCDVRVIACTEAGCSVDDFYITVSTKAADSDSNVGIIVGIIVPVIIIIIAVIAVIVFVRMRRRRKQSAPPLPFQDLKKEERRSIRIRHFIDHVALLHKDSDLSFRKEIEAINAISSEYRCTPLDGQQGINKAVTYDKNQVHLTLPSSKANVKLFDACYIPGLNSKHDYIVTQCPKLNNIPDFWRMVWEQKSKVIVMLSDLTQKNKTTSHPYWPEDITKTIVHGNVMVEMTNASKLKKCIIREFKISVDKMNRLVTQFFFPAWCDSANLTINDALEFVQLVCGKTSVSSDGPCIIQSSVGVGRTGTFIALDYFMQYIDQHSLDDDINVFKYVLEMRKSQPLLVQDEAQYIFIFDALVEIIQRKMSSDEEHLYNVLEDHSYQSVITTEDKIYDVLQEEDIGEGMDKNMYSHLTTSTKATTSDDVPKSKDAIESDYVITE